MAKTKTYMVVRLKSSASLYSTYKKMTRKCMESIVAKNKGIIRYDPQAKKHCLFSLSRAK